MVLDIYLLYKYLYLILVENNFIVVVTKYIYIYIYVLRLYSWFNSKHFQHIFTKKYVEMTKHYKDTIICIYVITTLIPYFLVKTFRKSFTSKPRV